MATISASMRMFQYTRTAVSLSGKAGSGLVAMAAQFQLVLQAHVNVQVYMPESTQKIIMIMGQFDPFEQRSRKPIDITPEPIALPAGPEQSALPAGPKQLALTAGPPGVALPSAFIKRENLLRQQMAVWGRHLLTQLGSTMKKVTETVKASLAKMKQDARQAFAFISSQLSALGSKFAAKASTMNFQPFLELGQRALTGAMEQDQLKQQFIARTGDQQTGTDLFHKFKADAASSGQDVADYLKGTLSNFDRTRNTAEMKQLNDFASQLSLFDGSGKGYAQAIAAVGAAYRGDVSSLAKEYGLSQSEMQSMKLGELGKAGDMEGFSSALARLLQERGITGDSAEAMRNTPLHQFNALKTKGEQSLANAGTMALDALQPLLTQLNSLFDSGHIQVWFASLGAALSYFAQLAGTAMEWINNHWSTFQNMLVAVGLTIAALAVIWLVSWLAGMWPIFAIAAGIALLLQVLGFFGVTTEQVLGVVTGVFYGLFAFLHNNFAYLWNVVVAVAEFFANVFSEPAYAIEKLFYDLFSNVDEFALNMLLGVVKGIDWLLEKINTVFGTDLKLIGDISSSFPPVRKAPQKPSSDIKDFSSHKMKQMNLADAFTKGTNTMSDLVGKVNKFGGQLIPDTSGWSKSAKIDRVDEVGKIKDNVKVGGEVDIASEDLKLLRELADIRSIQNFVTLTPTVQVETGDIKSASDVDELVRKITDSLQDEFARTAGGVYA
ncbi:hypothetical protein [Paenibacillus puerhi]|uniref:hypothetical protein n=1 Tax=Paenibacillus puerhi TaxID=2692622 RepID=UPI001359F053|nr:hypothetical protein [Paenibacillus puerhi]